MLKRALILNSFNKIALQNAANRSKIRKQSANEITLWMRVTRGVSVNDIQSPGTTEMDFDSIPASSKQCVGPISRVSIELL